MVELFKKDYWSKSQAFLLPLTGLSKSQKYTLKTYLFWNEYSIENFNLILKFVYDDYEEFVKYCRRIVFPILDRNGYLIETHDYKNETILVLELGEWALDIEMFLQGKYSKMSREAKARITEFHIFHDNGPRILIDISAALAPNVKDPLLGDLSPISYVAEYYGLDIRKMQELGEACSVYDKTQETLETIEENVRL